MRIPSWLLIPMALACAGDDPTKVDTATGDTGPVPTTETSDTGTTTPTPTTPTLPTSEEYVVNDCARNLPAPLSGQTCAITGDPDTATAVILQGDVLGDPDVYIGGEIRFALGAANATIECVGCDCSTSDEVVVVSCPDAVITPGLINSHDHIRYAAETVKDNGDERYDHRHDWRRGTRDHTEIDTDSIDSPEVVLYGELRMLLGGATSIAGSISSVDTAGLMRNLDSDTYNEGLNPGDVDYSTFPLGDVITPVLEIDDCTRYNPESSNVLNNEIYLPHISEGIDLEARNEFACLSGEGPQSVDYIQDNTSIIHGIGMTAYDIALAGSRGAHLVWSPRSNLSLYGDTANVVTWDRFEVPIALGTDWIPSGSSNLLRELACADSFNRDHLGGYFSDYRLWHMVTRDAAVAMGVDDQLGRLAVGTIADVAIFANHGERVHGAVVRSSIDDVALVLRGGRPLTGEQSIMEGLVPSSEIGSCDALASCVDGHLVCVDRPGFSLASIEGGVPGGAYPLYICEEPADEPSCVPFRDNEDNDGVIYPTSSPNDTDLDGEDDDVDNCPTIFNPRRPLDGRVQPDVDGDGEGDACDVCPLQTGTMCELGDLDGDGVADDVDNCPRDPNGDQADMDGDGIGAACDACDDFPAANGACDATIYDVKQGLRTGELVVVSDLVVTAIRPGNGWFAQLDPASASYAGVEFSGVFTFSPSDVGSVALGDVVEIEASVADFFGQLQLSNVVSLTVTGTASVPLPVVVDPVDVQTGGALADDYEAVLVRVEDVEVTAVQIPAVPGDGDSNPTNEFAVDGGVRVNDLLYQVDPLPAVGDDFVFVQGPLRFGNNNSKIEPRDELDVGRGASDIASLEPLFLPIEQGSTEQMTVGLTFPVGQITTVTITCTPNTLVNCPPTVDVPANQTEATFGIEGVANGAVTVTATVGTSLTSDVEVYDDTSVRGYVSLEPTVLSLQPGATAPLTLTITLPAPSSGLMVPVSADPELTVPGTVTIPAGASTVDIPVTAGLMTGTYGVVVDGVLGSTVEVANLPSGTGIAFWEYAEPTTGGVGGNNKFLEIKNLSGSPFDLTGCEVESVVNGGSSTNGFDFDPVTLAPGEIYLVCPSNESNPIAVGGTCRQSESLTFNGDDAQVLLCGGVVMDVIGQRGVDPGDEWGDATTGTQNATLRRNCTVTVGDTDDTDPFDPSLEWTQVAGDADGTNLGLDHCP